LTLLAVAAAPVSWICTFLLIVGYSITYSRDLNKELCTFFTPLFEKVFNGIRRARHK